MSIPGKVPADLCVGYESKTTHERRGGKRWLCFMRELGYLEPLHLNKDVVVLPAYMGKLGWRCTIACYKNPELMVPEKWQGVELRGFRESNWPFHFGSSFFKNWQMMLWLAINARRIDLLMCMHIRRANALFALVYKLFNPCGRAFLKTDTGTEVFDSIISVARFRKSLLLILKRCDVVIFETKAAYLNALNHLERLGVSSINLRYLPNGFDDSTEMTRTPVAQKERLIVTVGRLGTEEKNNELLLAALGQVHLDGWKVMFVGSLEGGFAESGGGASTQASATEGEHSADRLLG